MSVELAEQFGPPPFRFTPQPDPLVSPAFSWSFKLLATVMLFALAVWMLQLWHGGQLTPPGTSTAAALGWPIAALGVMAYTWWHLVTGHTTLGAGRIEQRWMWRRSLELRELAFVRIIRVPGLDWLIAPRLYARTLMGRFAIFYAADPVMLAQWQRLERELRAFREFR